MRIKLVARIAVASVCAAMCAAFAQELEGAAPLPQGDIDPVELEAFVDGLMAAHLKAYNVPGAAVSIVKDGEILLAKGYGYADLEANEKVGADRTLFRIGSVSKLFVWTAVMQLVEQGKLDLDADINQYLTDFQIPDTYSKPITLSHLMTHTPGFEDRVLGLFARNEKGLRPLGALLAAQIPTRVRPPGVEASYSNHGAAIAAHIVELVSGMAWDDYVESEILNPLGMGHATFRQPVPNSLAGGMSVGYRGVKDRYTVQDFEFVPISPAGSASATASDMANFMLAHLQYGQWGESRILQEATARTMQSELFRHAPGVNAMAHGFYEMNRNGKRIIGHGGDTLWFHTLLALVPGENLGFFVSYNSEGGALAPPAFLEAILDRLYPIGDAPALEASGAFAERAGKYVGTYRVNRYSHTTPAKIAAIGALVRVADSGDGALLLNSTGAARWIEVEPGQFRREDGYETLAFRVDGEEKATRLYLGSLPIMALERIAWWEADIAQGAAAGFAALLFLSVALGWPAGSWWRWRSGLKLDSGLLVPRGLRVIGWLAGTVYLLFMAGLGISLLDPIQIVYGIPPLLEYALYLPVAGAVLSVLALFCMVAIWIKKWGRWTARIHYTGLTVACALFLWQIYYWNLYDIDFLLEWTNRSAES